ncbi:glucose-6-phosphate dehydrogenase assembly protein OpcA [Nakamurella sp. GG22]
MIVDLPTTNSSKINKTLVDMREKGGSVALGRVLTLVIVTEDAATEDPIAAANAASFEHPCRVIVVARGSRRASPRLDAQIRVGGDAGASEVVVLRLYGPLVDHAASVVVPLLLADAPVVAWWPGEAPDMPAEDPIGKLAQRRVTDAASAKRPVAQLAKRRESYRPGDTDLAWTRLTRWRGLLASTLDQPPHDKVTAAVVAGSADSPSADLLAAWLALALKVPVERVKAPSKAGPGLHSVVLSRKAGDISLVRPQTITAELKVGGQPERRIALPRRGLRDCLSEELRRLDADDVYAEVLNKGMSLVAKYAEAKTASAAKGGTPAAKTGKSAPSRRAPAKAASAEPAPDREEVAKSAVAASEGPSDAPGGTEEMTAAGSDAPSASASPGADGAGRTRARRASRGSSGGAGTGPTRRRSAARKSGSS